jgi:hypothetical protein
MRPDPLSHAQSLLAFQSMMAPSLASILAASDPSLRTNAITQMQTLLP